MPEFYCPEHRYNPPPNSGLAFCPYCEAGADLTAAEYAQLHGPEWYEEDPGLCDCGRMAEIMVDDEGNEYYSCGHCGAEWPCEEE